MGNSWSYVPNDTYKSANDLVHMLVKIVSRGGNFLLNIGPSPNGDFSDTAYNRLAALGSWMNVHGEAIYGTIPMAPYEKDNVVYMQSKDKKTVYLYVLSNNKETVELPASISLAQINITKKSKIIYLDAPKEKIGMQQKNNELTLTIPAGLQQKSGAIYAATFKIIL
jgi:alpha-L-fucosidase